MAYFIIDNNANLKRCVVFTLMWFVAQLCCWLTCSVTGTHPYF